MHIAGQYLLGFLIGMSTGIALLIFLFNKFRDALESRVVDY
jgi:hypothetical protein